MMTNPETAVQAASWSDTIKGHIQDLWAKVQESHSLLFTMALYGGVGFVAGYLCKKYAHFLVFLIMLAVMISFLQQLDYLSCTINWVKVYGLIGFDQPVDISDVSFVTYLFDWIKNNLAAVVSLAVGFLLGLRFG